MSVLNRPVFAHQGGFLMSGSILAPAPPRADRRAGKGAKPSLFCPLPGWTATGDGRRYLANFKPAEWRIQQLTRVQVAHPRCTVRPMSTKQPPTWEHSPAITVNEAARRLSVTPHTIRRRIAAGDLPAARVGRAVRIRPEDLASLYTTPESGEGD